MKKATKVLGLIILGLTLFLGYCKNKSDSSSESSAVSKDVGGYYTCSMHPQVIEKEPGNCPICGMPLQFVGGSQIKHHHKHKAGMDSMDMSKKETTQKESKETQMYVCPMHPEVTSDHPGICPKCGMGLIRMKHHKHKQAGKSSKRHFQFSIEENILTNANLLTTPAKKERFAIKANYAGHIDFNEDPNRLAIVTTKYDGWVEQLYVSKEGVNIARGQLLMGVYSPSLLSAKEEYLTTYLSLKGLYESQGKSLDEMKNDATLVAAKRKLRYLDVSEGEIKKIETQQKAGRLTYFYSPIGGTVVKKEILQGAYIKSGQEVMRIANLNSLWVYIHVFEKDLAFIRKGQRAVLTTAAYPDKEYAGNVDLIYPFLDPMTKDIKVRIVLSNASGLLKPGMFADVNLTDSLPGNVIVIPDTAIIHSGDKNYVFVSLGAGDFELRPVVIKISSDGKSVIAGGLDHNELVVVNGQFLLDSEASLKDAVAKGEASSHQHQH